MDGDRSFETGHGAQPLARAVHHAGVQFVAPGGIGRCAPPGDIEPTGFHLGDRLDHHVERGGAGAEAIPSRFDETGHMIELATVVGLAQRAGPAVDRHGYGSRFPGGHGRLFRCFAPVTRFG